MPVAETYGFVFPNSPVDRSVPANIAEGYGRESTRSYILFLKTARGSLREFETHVLLAERIGLLANNEAQALVKNAETLGKMLYALIRSLNKIKPAAP